MTARVWLLAAILCGAAAPRAGTADIDALQGRWYVETAFGDQQLLENPSSHEFIVKAMSSQEGKGAYRVSSHEIEDYYYHQTCTIENVHNIGDTDTLYNNVNRPYPLSSYVDKKGNVISPQMVSGQVYTMSIGKCSGTLQGVADLIESTTFIRTDQNLYLYGGVVMLKLTKRKP